MKAPALFFIAFVCLCAVASAQSVVTKPDLVGHISQSGTKLIVTVENAAQKNPLNSSGKARSSTAKLTLGGQEQTIQVPELLPDSDFKKEFPIPASLLNQSFTATLKVDAGGVVPESNETNNTFTATFNECDLLPVKGALGRLELSWDNKTAPGIYHFRVKNNGIRKAPRSVTRITITKQGQPGEAVNVTTPEIAPGATVSLSFTYKGDICYYKIEAECDVLHAVPESNQANNIAQITLTCED